MTGRRRNQAQDKRHLLDTAGGDLARDDAQGHDLDKEVKDGSHKLSLTQKVMLGAQQLGNEASCNFGDLYNVPTLQTLGMPMKLVSLPGLIGGPVAFVLVLLLGWFSDKGPNPHLRKAAAFLFSTGFLVTGLTCVILANVLHIKEIHVEEEMRELENSSATTPATSAQTGFHNTTDDEVSFKAGLGMLGFVLTGIGVTCTHSSINSWVLSSSPRSEHTSVLVLSLIMSSLGGVCTAALGMVDLASAFRFDLTEGAGLVVQVSLQAGVIVLAIIIGTSVSLWMGRKIHLDRGVLDSFSSCASSSDTDQQGDHSRPAEDAVDDVDSTMSKDPVTDSYQARGLRDSDTRGFEDQLGNPSKQIDYAVDGVDNTISKDPETDSNQARDSGEGDTRGFEERVAVIQGDAFSDQNVVKYCYSPKQATSKYYGTQDHTVTSSPNCATSNSLDPDSTRPASIESVHGTVANTRLCWLFARCGLTDFRFRIGLVCLSAYFSIGVIYMFALMSSDYVGKAIYGGDPRAKPGSPSLVNYQAGVRMASWGFLVYYCVYMLFNPFHERVLARLGYRGEYVPIHLLMSGSLVLLAMTARLEAYFLLSGLAGLHRACFYSIPFAVTNDIIQTQAERAQTAGGPRVGLAMSVVTGMIPLAFTTLYPWVGPLEQFTGVVAVPMWLGAIFAALSAFAFLTV